MKTTIVLRNVYCDVTYPDYLHVCNRYYKNPTTFCDCIFVPHIISSNRNQTVDNKSSPEQMLYNICSTFIKEFPGINLYNICSIYRWK